MPCSDFVNGRLEKKVPPKKSHSWRSLNITVPEHSTYNSVLNYKDSKPDCGEIRPLNMGPNSVQSDLQNHNDHGFESSPPENDMPLDFSVKPESKNCRSEDRATSTQGGQPDRLNSFNYPFAIPNGERNASPMVHISNGMDSHYSLKTHKNVQKPVKTVVSPRRKENSDYFDEIKPDLSQMNAKFTDTQKMKSPQPHWQSSNSLSKSPILAGILAGGPTDVLPTVEALNSGMVPFGLPNLNGFNSMCVPGGIQNPTPVMANPSVFQRNNVIAASGLTFMQPQMNLLSPIAQFPLQSQIENKATRKGKQDRPFKNYDVNLQDDLTQCNTLTWPVIASINSRAIDESSQSDANHPEQVTVSSPPKVNPVNGNSENSSHSDPPSTISEMDNTPHSSVPNNALEEGAEVDKNNRSRKRKPVAESEKDALYWERRKKNNQAAKRSRENRRIKEDKVAEQASYYRAESARMSAIIYHLAAQVREFEIKCTTLEHEKLNLTTENALYKHALSQRRCGECGNPLGNNTL